ncbi:MAG: AsmA family protein, partial [Planctomycetes bacterium]|nr:AsmA family protein [Planctomycetota bacterium]
MKKKLLIAAAIVLLLVVGAVMGIVIYSGDLLKVGVERGGTQAMKTETTLGGAGLSILGGSVSLSNLNIRNPEGFKEQYAFSIGETSVDTNLGSLLSNTIEVERILIASPHVALEVSTSGTNLGSLLGNLESSRKEAEAPPTTTEETPSEDAGPSKQLIVRDLTITDAKVILTQSVLGQTTIELTLPELKLKDVGTQQDPASMAEVMQQVVAAIMAGVISSDQIPPEIAALLRGELNLASLDALKAQLEGQLKAGLAQGKEVLDKGLGDAKDALNKAGDALGEKAGDLGKQAGALGEQLGEKTGALGEKAGELGAGAGEKAGEASEQADEKV